MAEGVIGLTATPHTCSCNTNESQMQAMGGYTRFQLLKASVMEGFSYWRPWLLKALAIEGFGYCRLRLLMALVIEGFS